MRLTVNQNVVGSIPTSGAMSFLGGVMAAQRSPKPFVGVRVPPGKPDTVRWPSGPRQLPAKQPNRGFESHPHFHLGGLAQLGRASALQAEGHRFDPDILHQAYLGLG